VDETALTILPPFRRVHAQWPLVRVESPLSFEFRAGQDSSRVDVEVLVTEQTPTLARVRAIDRGRPSLRPFRFVAWPEQLPSQQLPSTSYRPAVTASSSSSAAS